MATTKLSKKEEGLPTDLGNGLIDWFNWFCQWAVKNEAHMYKAGYKERYGGFYMNSK